MVKYIIKSNEAVLLFDNLLKKGYNYISEYLSCDKKDIPIKNHDNIRVEIY